MTKKHVGIFSGVVAASLLAAHLATRAPREIEPTYTEFAIVDDQGIVQQVIVIDPAEAAKRTAKDGKKYVQTCEPYLSSDQAKTPQRKNIPGIGHKYDEQKAAFIAPQPFPSWTLDEQTAKYRAPVDMPKDGKFYTWDEKSLKWVEVPK